MALPAQNVIAVAIADCLTKKGTPSHVAALMSIDAAACVRGALDREGYRLLAPPEKGGRDE